MRSWKHKEVSRYSVFNRSDVTFNTLHVIDWVNKTTTITTITRIMWIWMFEKNGEHERRRVKMKHYILKMYFVGSVGSCALVWHPIELAARQSLASELQILLENTLNIFSIKLSNTKTVDGFCGKQFWIGSKSSSILALFVAKQLRR